MKLMTSFTFLLICLTATGQNSTVKKGIYVDTEVVYTDPNGRTLRIINSLPKGGGDIDGEKAYTDATGKPYGYAVFWTRVINESASPVELTVNFPAAPIVLKADPLLVYYSDTQVKLFLPEDSMTPDKVSLYNYGITGLRSFLNSNWNKPTMLQRTLKPKEEFFFYVALLSSGPGGRVRAGFVLEEQDLLYSFSIGDDPGSVSCGQIDFKD